MTYLIGFALFHFLGLAFLILACIAVAGSIRDRRLGEQRKVRTSAAREILRRRFALGEIPETDYREKLSILDR